jgi:ribonuclease HI
MLKINTDGAFNPETCQGGWGFVVQDNLGDARGSGAGAVRHAWSALQMEAHAIWEAAHAAAGWGMGRIILETDSLILARAMQSTDYDLAPEGYLIRDIRYFFS